MSSGPYGSIFNMSSLAFMFVHCVCFQGFQADTNQRGASAPPTQSGKLVGAFDDALADTDEEKTENKRYPCLQ